LFFISLLEHNNPLQLYISDCGKKVLLLSGFRQVFLWETQESNEALNNTSGMCCIICKKKLPCKKWIFLYFVSFSSRANFKKHCVILSNYLKGNLVLSTGLIIWIGNRKEIRKLTFQVLALRRSEFACYTSHRRSTTVSLETYPYNYLII